ncbi:MAG: thiolase family protein [Clostridia bacterium]|jgi:acetyl-CoA C-acetyltransferase|nr:thiolase family protein [Clostridia bacterium]MDH7573219.1 thiolase family protein [Clostridia bacterium]
MERNVCLIAGGMSQWGVREASQRDLFQEAAKACFEDNPAVRPTDVDGLIVASAFTERCSFQTHLAPLVAEQLGIRPRSVCARVELLCASGSSALIMAYGLIKSGAADVVMVAGGEKLYMPQRWEVFYSELGTADREWDGAQGLGLPPPIFAMVAKQHMKLYGTTEEQMALVAVKNRRNGVNNPRGQFRQPIDLETALNARPIVSPLKLYDCCPVTDGAAAVILACEEKARDLTDRPLVYVRGTGQATLHNMSANQPNWTTWEALRIAAQMAYKRAGVKPADIDVAQTHDCFTISEIIEYEDLGFCEKGEGGWFVQEGKSDFGGQVAVNTDGGLLSCGHPFGGTGLRQAIEIMKQLQGRAARQVEGARFGLTHNLSGPAAAHTVIIYGRDKS